MEPTVQLLHELPDGSMHVDWMLSRGPDEPLVTFRLDRRFDDLPVGATLPARRIADHRRRYLRYEGAIDGGRGTVRRLCAGEIAQWQEDAGGPWRLAIAWSGAVAAQHLRLDPPREGDAWVISVVA
jgi:hypothetical protein